MDRYEQLAELTERTFANAKAVTTEDATEKSKQINEIVDPLLEFMVENFKPAATEENRQKATAISDGSQTAQGTPLAETLSSYGDTAPLHVIRHALQVERLPINGKDSKNWSRFVDTYKDILIDS